ncbi:MAG: glycosyltransferase family 2 protein [Lachnospiraceae bacterium]|nr:glycosyltransferase family 2 protein [Lachnospiraceae bacterium]
MDKSAITGRPVLWMVIPCYNEEAVLMKTAPMFLDELHALTQKDLISDKSRILFVNDGSKDRTWEIIRYFAEKDSHFIGISQSRNRGHQNAVLAGLMEARENCDFTISIDCDGQDDISAMEKMTEEYLAGAEVVYGVRSKRETDTFFKRFTAETFYKFMKALGADVVYNHADYRLISSRALDELADFEEVNLFLRGMVPLVGFKSAVVTYERHERLAGKSHYPLSKMLRLAMDGITSLSVRPLSIIAGVGAVVGVIGLIGIIWAIVTALSGNSVQGWASLVCVVCFLGGIQLLSLGVVGQYIGKIYLETKRRPRYIIAERTWEPYERNYKGGVN